MISTISKLVTISAIIAGSILPVANVSAAASNLSVAASTSAITNGGSFIVNVTESAANVNVVTAKMTYDASKLTCNSATANNSDPFVRVATSCSGGSASISIYVSADPTTGQPRTVSGSQFVGSLSFTAISGTGSAAISTAAGSQLASNGTNVWDGSVSTATVALSMPSTPTPGMGGGPASTNTGTTTTANPTTKNVTNSSTTNTTTSNNSTANSPTTETSGQQTITTSTKKPVVKKTVPTLKKHSRSFGTTARITGLIIVLLGLAYLLRKQIMVLAGKFSKANAEVIAPAVKAAKKAPAAATLVTAKRVTKSKPLAKTSVTKKK